MKRGTRVGRGEVLPPGATPQGTPRKKRKQRAKIGGAGTAVRGAARGMDIVLLEDAPSDRHADPAVVRIGHGKPIAPAAQPLVASGLVTKVAGLAAGTDPALGGIPSVHSLLASAIAVSIADLIQKLRSERCVLDDMEAAVLLVLKRRLGMTVEQIEGALMFLDKPSSPELLAHTLQKLAQFPAVRDGAPVKLVERCLDGRWFARC